jgi:hypothetical protein
MASKLPPFVEANINTLMNVADEEVWKVEGLFDQVDSVVIRTDTINTPSKQPQLPPLQRSSHSSVPALSFAEYLRFSFWFPQATERHTVTQSHEAKG